MEKPTTYEMKMPLKKAVSAVNEFLAMKHEMTTLTGWQIRMLQEAISSIMYAYHAEVFQRIMKEKKDENDRA